MALVVLARDMERDALGEFGKLDLQDLAGASEALAMIRNWYGNELKMSTPPGPEVTRPRTRT